MLTKIKRKNRLNLRHRRIRKKIFGVLDQPRLCVHKSLKNIYAQIIDDSNNKVLVYASSLDKNFHQKCTYGGNVKAAEQLGVVLAEKAKQKGITKVIFDRGGHLYHGRVKAFAESARKAGLVF